MKGNLYLTGFMGAGKTTLGRELSHALGWGFLDLDCEVERRLGLSVAEIFRRQGEAAFRQAESRELRRVSRRRGLVVATGGGLPCSEANRRLMQESGIVLHLAASLEGCRGRLDRAGRAARPLWRDRAALERLFAQRRAAYAHCDLSLEVEGKDPGRLLDEALAGLFPLRRATVRLEGREHPLLGTWRGPEVLAGLVRGRRVALLTDAHLARLPLVRRYRQRLPEALELVVAPGERSKSLTTAGRLYRRLLEARLDRGDLLVALGGGMVTDLGALVGATYKRGMDLVLVSTSLLGCVDAAVGGKAGINLGGVKNLVGCFTTPQAVVLDLRALRGLDRRRRAEGLVEAYKTGLVAEAPLARLIEEELNRLLAGEVPLLAEVAWHSAQAKARVVGEDFRESGRRRILNLGHTYGHALEALSRYRLGHGRAVAWGTLVAAAISRKRGLIGDDLYQRIQGVMRRLGGRPPRLPSVEAAWPLMLNDKKNRGGKVCFVLLAGVGDPLWVDDVTPAELAAALRRVEEEVHV